ncbi:WhiB family transcriptional regulator [Saccharomonospora viridis]|uniref:WhiB family transcriptional regulator n=1 Tax=Saccharomonospora viridis TaxID=1852 RepID=UPI0023F0BB32|nr:WhiB family transcriptional regulator [Saccharomonospora viridis]
MRADLRIVEPSSESWWAAALCQQTDPEAFFPDKGGSNREAKRVCRACPVREECKAYALDNNEQFGVWGGLTERERRALRKSRSREVKAA